MIVKYVPIVCLLKSRNTCSDDLHIMYWYLINIHHYQMYIYIMYTTCYI